MPLRWIYLLGIAVLLASEAGCCCCCGPIAERTWCGCQCGEVWWHEWFSHPPDCCEPCNNCGRFTRSQNPYVESGPSRASQGFAYSGPARRGPAEVVPPGTKYDWAPLEPTPSEPMPSEELPLPGPSARAHRDELGQTSPGNRPVDSPRTSRKLGSPRRPARYVQ
jgi:hypothetical protein